MLVGTHLNSIGRSCNLLWFKFCSEEIEIFLHTQCIVRIIKQNGVIVTSEDIYLPFAENEDFDWEVYGNSIYDIRLNELISKNKYAVISFEKENMLNDYKIVLNDDLIIQLLDNKPLDDECERWRVFRKSDKHYVLYDKLIIE